MEFILQIQGLTKSYGHFQALKGISFQIEKGSVFGVLGPNGSGKTTTLGIILDVLQSDGGTFSWFGGVPGEDARKRIGAILEQPNFYPYLSAVDNLKVVAQIKEVPYDNIDAVLKRVNLWDRKDSAFKTFSLGMKQRLAVAAALLNDPEVLVLDEPTNGLDPQGIAEIRELIIDVAAQGTTILLASHMLDEVEKVCTHVAVLQFGEILVSGAVGEVLSDEAQLEVAVADMETIKLLLVEHPNVQKVSVESDHLLVTPRGDLSAEQLCRLLVEHGHYPHHLRTRKKSLETQFLEMTQS